MSQTPPNTDPLTVVLVHGAFADASSWTGVIERLQQAGVQVTVPANPLRGLASDSAYLASFLTQISSPVLAVGHSYAGAVITNVATRASNVVGLVFVAAFAPDDGERLGDIESGSQECEPIGKKDATCWRLTSPGTLAILRGVGCARGGSTLSGGSGAGRKTPDPPCNFILGSRAHFGRTREAVYSRQSKKSLEQPVSM